MSRPSQGRSVPGIDAQREAIRCFAEAESLDIIGEHTDVDALQETEAVASNFVAALLVETKSYAQ